jgi:hypothetical protein
MICTTSCQSGRPLLRARQVQFLHAFQERPAQQFSTQSQIMKLKLTIVLLLFGSSSFLTQNLSANVAIAVASNGKWAIARDKSIDSNGVSAQAIQQCKAKGGADAKVVYATSNAQAAHGAVAVSDNGTGKIVGFSFIQTSPHRHMSMDFSHQAESAAIKDCQKKGGQNPKIVTTW